MEKNQDKPVDYSKPLKNSKYERFCQEYVVDNNATASAKRAKYSKKTCHVKGSQLLEIVSIKKRLVYLQAQLAEATGVTAKMIIDEFKKIAFGVAGKNLRYSDKNKALDNLGKHIGFYGKDNEQKKDSFSDMIKEISANGTGLPIKIIK